jgi:hypothetical protein
MSWHEQRSLGFGTPQAPRKSIYQPQLPAKRLTDFPRHWRSACQQAAPFTSDNGYSRKQSPALHVSGVGGWGPHYDRLIAQRPVARVLFS